MNVGAALVVGVFVALFAGALLGTMPRVRFALPARRAGTADTLVQQAGLGVSSSQLRGLSITAAAFTLIVLTAVTQSVLVAVVPAAAVGLLPRHAVARRARFRRRELQRRGPMVCATSSPRLAPVAR